MHEQMVRFATAEIRAGHFPLTAWYPYLGEGSPLFLHYQSLPAIVTGLAGLVVGPNVAFRWSLYLLLCLWPVSVYWAARLFGMPRWPAATAAAMSPLLSSVPGIGYEQHAYVWTGYGVWTQLWASMTLPLAWGFTWRALSRGRGYCVASATVALTVALHFETGYLAIFPLLLWPFVMPRRAVRLRQAGILLVGSLATCAWIIVPVLAQSRFAAINEALRDTPLANGYGAARVTDWLLTGQVLDHGRLPVITGFAALGVAEALVRARSDLSARALLVLLGGSLVLSFGPTTLGPVTALIPGSHDLFFRRFMMGTQLSLVLLAGAGAAQFGRITMAAWRWWADAGDPSVADTRRVLDDLPAWLATLLPCIALAVVLTPAWSQIDVSSQTNAAAIHQQHQADATSGRLLVPVINWIRERGGGRTYAGMQSNWGAQFRVGAVPVFKYLASKNVDEVGYTLRTASLMTGPEYHFQESDPSDYRLFAIRYLVLPVDRPPPVAADLVLTSGPYALWRTTPRDGYVFTGSIVGVLAANRTNIGAKTEGVVDGDLAASSLFLRISFGGPASASSGGASRAGTSVRPGIPDGTTVSTRGSPAAGTISATIRMRRPGVVVLSATFDPGWRALVDGRARPTLMVAPALTGVKIGSGTHRVTFQYVGYHSYAPLGVLCGLALASLLLTDRLAARRKPVLPQQ